MSGRHCRKTHRPSSCGRGQTDTRKFREGAHPADDDKRTAAPTGACCFCLPPWLTAGPNEERTKACAEGGADLRDGDRRRRGKSDCRIRRMFRSADRESGWVGRPIRPLSGGLGPELAVGLSYEEDVGETYHPPPLKMPQLYLSFDLDLAVCSAPGRARGRTGVVLFCPETYRTGALLMTCRYLKKNGALPPPWHEPREPKSIAAANAGEIIHFSLVQRQAA